MQSEVRVVQDERTEWCFELNQPLAMTSAEGREWLDAEFTQCGAEPLRPTGKLLLADMVLVIAREAGAKRLSDLDWGQRFAQATSAALGKPVVRIDLEGMTVSY